MSSKHLVVVPHTHWDREWYMPFEEFRKRLVTMMDHLLDVLENDRAFKYFELDGQTLILNDYLAIRPENEGRLRKLIEQGRIIIGPWYVQPDEFLVTGESLIRNLCMGINAAKKFGKPSMIGYMPDQFGHTAQMPQILAGLGMRAAIVWRGVGETVKNTQFLWESLDGTRLFTIYLADSYSNGAFLPLKPTALKNRLSEIVRKLDANCDIDSVLVMNGLDHLEPQDGLPAALEKAMRALPDTTFEMGNFTLFVKQAKKQAQSPPVHRGEFRSSQKSNLLPGVTSARVRQKQRDFINCRLLEKYVEPLATWAALCGDTRPYSNFIDRAWRLTLQNHPHDSICGCSVDAVHAEMETRFDKVQQIVKNLRDDALSFIADRLDTSWIDAQSAALVVFNPTSTANQVVDVVVDVEEPDLVNAIENRKDTLIPLQKSVGERETFIGLQAPPEVIREQVEGMEGVELIGFYINNMFWQRDGKVLKLSLIMGRAPAGEVNKAEIEQRKRNLLSALDDPEIEIVDVKGISGAKTRLSFFAEDLCPAGVSVRSLSPKAITALSQKLLKISSEVLENAFYRVSVNEDGTLNIMDKQSGMEFNRCLRFTDEGDRGDSYNFDEITGGEIVDAPAGPPKVEIIENGPVRATLRIDSCFRIPEKIEPGREARSPNRVETAITTHVSVYRDIRRIDFRTEMDNQCEDHRLRVAFNAPFVSKEILSETAFGVIRRPTKVDSGEGYIEKPIGTGPQKTFSCIENESAGMALFNRGIPEIEATAGDKSTTIALTLLRSVGWLSRDDLKMRPAAAGPQLEAPGAQSKGIHRFDYAFTSYQGGFDEALIAEQAHAYAFPPIATITNCHKGKNRDGSSLVKGDNPNVIVSAITPSRSKHAYLVRLYNTTDRPQRTRLALWGRDLTVYHVNPLEKKLSREPLPGKGKRVGLALGPSQIVTLQVNARE